MSLLTRNRQGAFAQRLFFFPYMVRVILSLQTEAEAELKVASFETREEAMERIEEVQPRFTIEPDRVFDPEDPNADAEGYKRVISVSLNKDADKLYLCTDDNLL